MCVKSLPLLLFYSYFLETSLKLLPKDKLQSIKTNIETLKIKRKEALSSGKKSMAKRIRRSLKKC